MYSRLESARSDFVSRKRVLDLTNFAWRDVVKNIGIKYKSQVGLTIQIFDKHHNVEFLYANFDELFVDLYVKYNYINPWQEILYKKPTGYVIIGEKDSNFTEFMHKYAQFQNHVMIHHDVNYGIGAILLKENELNPQYTVSLIALRSEKYGRYSNEEQSEFSRLIPMMVEAISWHPEIVIFANKYREGHYKNITDLKFRGKTLLFKIMFFDKYRCNLIEGGFSEEDATKATEMLRKFYIECGLPMPPAAPQIQDKMADPQPASPNPQTTVPLRLPSEIGETEKYAAWSKRNGSSIEKFFEKGWPAPYVGEKMLERAQLRTLDLSAYKALENAVNYWRRQKKPIPDILQLPTRVQAPVKLSHAEREALRMAEKTAREIRTAAKK